MRLNFIKKIIFAILFLLPNIYALEKGNVYLEMGGGYKTGDFGTSSRTNLYYESPSLGYITSTYDVNITLPYLSLTTGSNNVNDIGDTILNVNFEVIPEENNNFGLDSAITLKLPTGNENKGLSTGNRDYGTFISFQKSLKEIKLSLSTGFIKTGDSALQSYDDILPYGLTLSKIFAITNIYASLEGRKYLSINGSNPLAFYMGFFRILNKQYSLKGNTFLGLNKDSPDFGIGLGVVRWF
ncbi:hypothetical protein HY745_01270 [Candidatus Desantisbacteria bacterium]|nr:hypothetical protein [Candidatus Desantisbacteria bacterium]